jgi:processing peptidase subunit beta
MLKLLRSQPQRFVRNFSGFPNCSQYPATQVSTLGNGIRVATEHGNGDLATVGVWVNTGSRYESDSNSGVANYLEHMIYKGTPALSDGASKGCNLNVSTSRESTFYHFTGAASETNLMLSNLAAMLQSDLSAEAVDAERAAVLQQADEGTGDVHDVLFDRLHQTAYRGHALGRTISGPAENIQNFTKEDLQGFKDAHYTGPNMVVCGAGNIDHAALVKLSESLFTSVPKQPRGEPGFTSAHFTGSDIRIRYDSMPVCHLAVGFPTAGWTDPDHIPLLLCEQLLGNFVRANDWGAGLYHQSPLVNENAGGHEWYADTIDVHNIQYSDTGLFGINVTAHERCLGRVIEDMFQATTRLFYNLTDIELETAKNNAKRKMLSNLDTTEKVAAEVGRQVTSYGRRIHPTELVDRIEAVDEAALQNCAQRFFYDRDYALAAIGPTIELHDYTFYRQRTWWKRY